MDQKAKILTGSKRFYVYELKDQHGKRTSVEEETRILSILSNALLNLSELSRRIGHSRQYLKHVIAGRRRLSKRSVRLLNAELDALCTRLSDKKGV